MGRWSSAKRRLRDWPQSLIDIVLSDQVVGPCYLPWAVIAEPSPSYHDSLLAVLDMLSRGPVVITVDSRHSDVVVPDHLRGPALALAVAYNSLLKRPIPDLEVDATGIRCTMSFSASPHRVELPWHRIWRANSEHRSVLWGERVPAEVAGLERPGVLLQNEKPVPTAVRHLRLVTDDPA